MLTRPIPRAGRDVTVVGLGTRGLGGGLRGIEPEDVARVVPAAIEMGVTLVDVSPAWADSLRVVGDAVRGVLPVGGGRLPGGVVHVLDARGCVLGPA